MFSPFVPSPIITAWLRLVLMCVAVGWLGLWDWMGPLTFVAASTIDGIGRVIPRIGWGENLQEEPHLTGKTHGGFLEDFPSNLKLLAFRIRRQKIGLHCCRWRIQKNIRLRRAPAASKTATVFVFFRKAKAYCVEHWLRMLTINHPWLPTCSITVGHAVLHVMIVDSIPPLVCQCPLFSKASPVLQYSACFVDYDQRLPRNRTATCFVDLHRFYPRQLAHDMEVSWNDCTPQIIHF